MAQPTDLEVRANDCVTFGVKTAGQGEPVVFFHNAAGLIWDPFLDKLSDHYQVFAPYLPGTGASSGIEHIRDLWDLVLCCDDLMERLGLESANLIGHSLGGMIAAELAASQPHRVKRLVAISPFGLFREDHPIPDMFAMLPEEVIRILVADPHSEIADQMRHIPEDIDERMEQHIQRVENLMAAAKFLWPIPDKGLKHRIHRIKCPTLLIWGMEDRLVPLVYAEDFQRKIPHSSLKVIDRAAHSVTLEQTEEVIAAIREFI